MASASINRSLTEIYRFLFQNYSNDEIHIISNELNKIVEHNLGSYSDFSTSRTYDDIQRFLSTVNEKESIRKSNGV